MKRIVILLGALTLGACQLPATFGTVSPAPLAQTAIDDKALQAAWASFDLALDGINTLIDTNFIKPGTPKAVKVANGIDKVTAILTAAESAAAAGSSKDYLVALSQVRGAITELRAALKGSN